MVHANAYSYDFAYYSIALTKVGRPDENISVCLRLLTAHAQNEIQIVQASLLGSILANLLLILGMCFLLGGLRYREQVKTFSLSMEKCSQRLDIQQHCHTNERLSP